MIDSVGTGSDGGGDTALGGRGAREHRDAGLWYDANYDEGLAAATLRAKDLVIPFRDTAVIVVSTVLLALAASVIPAYRAGNEKPLETLRKV